MKKLIKKVQQGTKIEKPWYERLKDGFINSTIGATVAENPAIMTASGWNKNNAGEWNQSNINDSGVKKLRDNLAELSLMSPTNPATAVLDKSLQYVTKGGRHLINKLLPKSQNTNYSYPITKQPFRYVVNGQYDTPTMVQEFKQGVTNARKFLNSDVYKQTAQRNIKEAEAMGLHYTPATDSEAFQSLMQDGVKPVWVPNASYGGAVRNGGDLGHITEIEINPASKINYTAFHEGLHVGDVPNQFSNETYSQFRNRVKKEMPYLKHKVNEVFSNVDGGTYDFGVQTGEAAVNMLVKDQV